MSTGQISVVCFVNNYLLDTSLSDRYVNKKSLYPLDSDLSSGQCYPPFEQLGPVL